MDVSESEGEVLQGFMQGQPEVPPTQVRVGPGGRVLEHPLFAKQSRGDLMDKLDAADPSLQEVNYASLPGTGDDLPPFSNAGRTVTGPGPLSLSALRAILLETWTDQGGNYADMDTTVEAAILCAMRRAVEDVQLAEWPTHHREFIVGVNRRLDKIEGAVVSLMSHVGELATLIGDLAKAKSGGSVLRKTARVTTMLMKAFAEGGK